MSLGGLYIGDKIRVAQLTSSGIPEGRAIVLVEMLHQVRKREKTLKEAAAVLIEVGFTRAQADAIMAGMKGLSEARGHKVAEHDFQTERSVFTHSWATPSVPPAIARRRGFSVLRGFKGRDQTASPGESCDK